jgi:hypothetical protein
MSPSISWFCGEIVSLKDFKEAVHESTTTLRQWTSSAMTMGMSRSTHRTTSGIVTNMDEWHDCDSNDLQPFDDNSVQNFSVSTEFNDGSSYASSVKPIWQTKMMKTTENTVYPTR